MSDSEAELRELVAAQAELIERLKARVAELERRLGADSSNSSRPPSSDSVYTKKVAKTRSSRQRSGRKPGKQPGDPGVSRSLTNNPDRTVRIDPDTCAGCNSSLAGSTPRTVERRQVVDLPPVPAPVITEYRLGARTCRCCGVETTAEWADLADIPDTPARTDVLAGPGSPVRIGPRALAMCAFLTCGHYLPVGRATQLSLWVQHPSLVPAVSDFLARLGQQVNKVGLPTNNWQLNSYVHWLDRKEATPRTPQDAVFRP